MPDEKTEKKIVKSISEMLTVSKVKCDKFMSRSRDLKSMYKYFYGRLCKGTKRNVLNKEGCKREKNNKD